MKLLLKVTPEAPTIPSLSPLNLAPIPLEIGAFVNYALYARRRLTGAEDGTFGTQLCNGVRTARFLLSALRHPAQAHARGGC